MLRFAATEVVPRLAGTAAEIDQVLRALDGRFIAAGPSGSPLRGLVNVLPTGRNFYSVDPKAVPSRLAWETGVAMADSLLDALPRRHRRAGRSRSGCRCGAPRRCAPRATTSPKCLRCWAFGRSGTTRRAGWSGWSRSRWPSWAGRESTSRSASPASSATRSRTSSRCSTTRSGWSRASTNPHDDNYVRAHAQADLAEHGDERRATTRIFGSKPGTYGAGLLQLIDSRNWRDDADLAEVYTAWGGFAYGRGLDGAPAADDMKRQYRRIAVAAKNTDTREHDIADSDDYFQYHGGMVATVRALTGQAPAAYIGDNTRPDAVRTRTPVGGDRRGCSVPAWSTRAGWPRCAGTATRAHSRWPPPSTTCSATTPPRA